jgi:hypothetical protein
MYDRWSSALAGQPCEHIDEPAAQMTPRRLGQGGWRGARAWADGRCTVVART